MGDHSAPDGNAKILQRLDQFLTDIATLLDYLGRLDNGRLQAHFDDTRSAVTDAVQFRAVPPCRTYSGFLARLAWLGTAIRMGQWPAAPVPQAGAAPRTPAGTKGGATAVPSGTDEVLGDIPFLVWSRDFLAAVAAPATVESIEISRAYVRARMHGGSWRRAWHKLHDAWQRTRPGGTQRVPVATGVAVDQIEVARPIATTDPRSGDEQADRVLLGRWLAALVKRVEWGAVLATLVALLVSTYVLSGQSFLNQHQSEAGTYAKLTQEIETILESFASSIVPTERGQTTTTGCDEAATSAATPVVAVLGTFAPSTDPAPEIGGATPGDQAKSRLKLRYFCNQRQQVAETLRVTMANLQAWFYPLTVHYDLRFVSLPSLAALFGYDTQWKPETVPTRSIDQPESVTRSVLNAVTLYLMPCLYGLIGAMAATLRMLRRKVDASTLSYTDRGRIVQDLILGVMCGATIGLFSGYILGANPAQGLGLSALALLAGYNVSGVFAFLDEVSGRMFRPSDAVPGKG